MCTEKFLNARWLVVPVARNYCLKLCSRTADRCPIRTWPKRTIERTRKSISHLRLAFRTRRVFARLTFFILRTENVRVRRVRQNVHLQTQHAETRRLVSFGREIFVHALPVQIHAQRQLVQTFAVRTPKRDRSAAESAGRERFLRKRSRRRTVSELRRYRYSDFKWFLKFGSIVTITVVYGARLGSFDFLSRSAFFAFKTFSPASPVEPVRKFYLRL